MTLVSRLRLDAALYEFAPSPGKGQRGRQREKGERFTSLKQLATDMTQPWRDAVVDWYGGETKKVRILIWHSSLVFFRRKTFAYSLGSGC